VIPVPVNLAVDSMSTPLTSGGDLSSALQDHQGQYRRAAALAGLTPREWSEVVERVNSDDFDGPSILPHRFASMAGNHRGSVYIIRNAQTSQQVYGYIIRLHDNKVVAFLSRCGNLSVVTPAHRAVVAARPAPRAVAHHPRRVAPLAYVAPPAPVTPVIVGPVTTDVPPAAAPPAVAAAPASARGGIGALPIFAAGAAALGGIVYGFSPHGGGGAALPGCSHGSNLQNVCQK
jgi:hypothetical protein